MSGLQHDLNSETLNIRHHLQRQQNQMVTKVTDTSVDQKDLELGSADPRQAKAGSMIECKSTS